MDPFSMIASSGAAKGALGGIGDAFGGIGEALGKGLGLDTGIGSIKTAPALEQFDWLKAQMSKQMKVAESKGWKLNPADLCIALCTQSPELLAYCRKLLNKYRKKRDPRTHSAIGAVTSTSKKKAGKWKKKYLKSEQGQRFLWLYRTLGLKYSYHQKYAKNPHNLSITRYARRPWSEAQKEAADVPEVQALWEMGAKGSKQAQIQELVGSSPAPGSALHAFLGAGPSSGPTVGGIPTGLSPQATRSASMNLNMSTTTMFMLGVMGGALIYLSRK